MSILVLITARGGSVTLPRKNILPFAGKPLIAWTIEAAEDARRRGASIARIVLSTDDPEIAKVGRDYGAEAPFLRPEELSRADTASLPVVQHAVGAVEPDQDRPFDWIMLLQPTSPLRTAEDILNAIAIASSDPGATSVISVTGANAGHPAKLKLVENGRLRPYLGDRLEQTRRQDFGFDVFRTNGAIYMTRRDVIMRDGSFYGDEPRAYEMPTERSADIDTRLDFDVAEFLFTRVGAQLREDGR
jgi:CMP-N,N'-diacetyllegionaminic acid synthase